MDEAVIGSVVDRQWSGREESEDVAGRYIRMIAVPSEWQWVVHGDTQEYRIRVFWNLVESGCHKKAEQFAMCGRGDEVQRSAKGFRVVPVRCGHRLCPRCVRYQGMKWVRRVFDHLRQLKHDRLWHIVLTQRVRPGESLEHCRERIGRTWGRLRKRGVGRFSAGLVTEHIKWSLGGGGWHVHYHLFVECSDGEDVLSQWQACAMEEQGDKVQAGFARLVCEAGEPLVDLDTAEGELWQEAGGDVARAVQYVVRDVVEGPNVKTAEQMPERAFDELCHNVAGIKAHRMLGRWRKKAKEVDENGTDVSGSAAGAGEAAEKQTWSVVATIDECLRKAFFSESRRVLRWLLECAGGNQGEFAKRCRRIVEVHLHQAEFG